VKWILKQYFPDNILPKKDVSKNHHYVNRTRVMKISDCIRYAVSPSDRGIERGRGTAWDEVHARDKPRVG
jgi:hypothetical protein